MKNKKMNLLQHSFNLIRRFETKIVFLLEQLAAFSYNSSDLLSHRNSRLDDWQTI